MNSPEQRGFHAVNFKDHYYDQNTHIFVPMRPGDEDALFEYHNRVLQFISGEPINYFRLPIQRLNDNIRIRSIKALESDLAQLFDKQSAKGWARKIFKPSRGVDAIAALSIERMHVHGVTADEVRSRAREGMYAALTDQQFEGLFPTSLVQRLHMSEAIMDWTTRLELTAQKTPDDLAA